MNVGTSQIDVNRDIGDFFYSLKPARDAGVGLTEQTIDYIADVKCEPDWIRAFRKKAYDIFLSKPLPTHWAGDELKEIDFYRIRYYLSSGGTPKRNWEDVPVRNDRAQTSGHRLRLRRPFAGNWQGAQGAPSTG
jgi:Fe-S cluster assembly protein SufB